MSTVIAVFQKLNQKSKMNNNPECVILLELNLLLLTTESANHPKYLFMRD